MIVLLHKCKPKSLIKFKKRFYIGFVSQTGNWLYTDGTIMFGEKGFKEKFKIVGTQREKVSDSLAFGIWLESKLGKIESGAHLIWSFHKRFA